MLTITDGGSLTRALSSSLDPGIKGLLRLRCEQLGGDIEHHARFLLAEPGDDLESLEAELGFPIFGEPELSFAPEWVADEEGLLEAVWILTDCGFAHVAVVPRGPGISPQLIEVFAAYASEHA